MRPSSVAHRPILRALVNGLITHDYVTNTRAPSFTTSLVVSRIPSTLRNNIRPMGVEMFKTAYLDLSRQERERDRPRSSAPRSILSNRGSRDREKQPVVPPGRISLGL